MLVRQAQRRVDKHFDDFFGRGVCHFLNVHAAFAGGHQRDTLCPTVSDRRDVVLFLDVCTVFDQQATDFLSRWARLVGHQLHTQNFTRQLLDLVNRARQLNATALASATGVNLSLDNPYRAA